MSREGRCAGLGHTRRGWAIGVGELSYPRADGRKSFAWTDCRDLIAAAHQQFVGPIVLVWDDVNTRLAAGMRRYIAERDRLTVYRLPSYAPDLNPAGGSGAQMIAIAEGVGSTMLKPL
ncbi:transposase [Spongiactinospora gelatinilytica]|uniref:transposase n=1 Tax=Spongiactinospora gelatinilytica TaxID=2666298 RepID=UPI0018F35267|nr:transposase [Spongiactinospora gelatinilytica]